MVEVRGGGQSRKNEDSCFWPWPVSTNDKTARRINRSTGVSKYSNYIVGKAASTADGNNTVVLLTSVEGGGVGLGVSGGLQPHRVNSYEGVVRVDYKRERKDTTGKSSWFLFRIPDR